ncbi:unnamed protein product [Lampetra planeri]
MLEVSVPRDSSNRFNSADASRDRRRLWRSGPQQQQQRRLQSSSRAIESGERRHGDAGTRSTRGFTPGQGHKDSLPGTPARGPTSASPTAGFQRPNPGSTPITTRVGRAGVGVVVSWVC